VNVNRGDCPADPFVRTSTDGDERLRASVEGIEEPPVHLVSQILPFPGAILDEWKVRLGQDAQITVAPLGDLPDFLRVPAHVSPMPNVRGKRIGVGDYEAVRPLCQPIFEGDLPLSYSYELGGRPNVGISRVPASLPIPPAVLWDPHRGVVRSELLGQRCRPGRLNSYNADPLRQECSSGRR